MHLRDFDNWLKTLLKPEFYKDYCPNGLVVESGDRINKVVTGVSLSLELIHAAIDQNADALIVHHPHGYWSNQPRLPIGTLGKKVRLLQQHGINLWGFHLPLDGHPEIGNNIGIARAIGAEPCGTFMREGQADVGLLCKFHKSLNQNELCSIISQVFDKSQTNHKLLFGPPQIDVIAICSGGGAGGIEEALQKGAHAYLTGELKEQSPIFAKEEGIHLIACGHHATEIFGPKLLAARITQDLGIPSEFVDIPNPV